MHRFETARLIMRGFCESDAEAVLRNWASDPEVQHEYGEPVYSDIDQVKALLSCYIQNSRFRWAIIEKCSSECIGQIAFCRVYDDIAAAEIEYCIGKAYWGNGYAGEALAGLIEHAFGNTGFLKLEAYHRKENLRSARVLRKSCMHITDTVERFSRHGIAPHGEVCYCVYKSEYERENIWQI